MVTGLTELFSSDDRQVDLLAFPIFLFSFFLLYKTLTQQIVNGKE